jgi:hypothetical protein
LRGAGGFLTGRFGFGLGGQEWVKLVLIWHSFVPL